MTTATFTRELVDGMAVLLAGAGINLTWRSTGAYSASETAIVVGGLPQSPDRAVGLTPYPLGDDAVFSDSDCGLQIRSRVATPDLRDVFDLDDAIADVLLGRFPFTLTTGVVVQTLVRTSAVSLGRDDNLRAEWSSNYTLGLHRPGQFRL